MSKEKSKGVGKVPEGTVAEITEWVGDDPRRAKKALKQENKSDSPRSTLVEALEKLAPAKDKGAGEDPEGAPGEEAEAENPEEDDADEDFELAEDEEPVEDAEETEPIDPQEATQEYEAELDDDDDDTTGYENEVGEGEEEVKKDG